jgi:hypothetical protein
VGKTLRSKWGLLALAAALTVGLATIPASGDSPPASDDLLRLHMGSGSGEITYESTTVDTSGMDPQTLTAGKQCELVSSGSDFVVITANSKGPGLVGNSIGVKSAGSNSSGVPCSRISGGEYLDLAFNVGSPAIAMELDLELKGDVVLDIVVNDETFTVKSGLDATGDREAAPNSDGVLELLLDGDGDNGVCRFAADSGPDSGPNDNCRVVVTPSQSFTSVRLVGQQGEVSLEGGGDYSATPDDRYDTIFYLQAWDGLLSCEDDPETEELENSTGEEFDGSVVVEIIRHPNADGSECVDKLFRLVPDAEDEQNGSVVFEVNDPASQDQAFFEAIITFDETLDAENPPMQGTLEYDPDGSDGYLNFKTMLACDEAPFDVNGDPVAGAIPDGHEGCVISVTQQFDGTTTWHAVFMGDWKFR